MDRDESEGGTLIHKSCHDAVRGVGIALIIRSLDGALIGFSARRLCLDWPHNPFPLAKHLEAGENADRTATLNSMLTNKGTAPFFTNTRIWPISLIAISGLNLVQPLKVHSRTTSVFFSHRRRPTIVALSVLAAISSGQSIPSGAGLNSSAMV